MTNPDWYNLTKVSNSTGVVNFLQGVNQILGGYFGTMILITVMGILLLTFLYKTNYSAKKAMVGTFAVGFFIALGMRSMSLIHNTTFFIVVVGFALSFGYGIFAGEE